jgi:hypothetical protein
LFIARGTRVMVVDTESGKAIGTIEDTPGVTVTTQKTARTMAVDARTHQVFTVAANVGPRPERK